MNAKKYSVFKNTPLQNKKQSGSDSDAEKLRRIQDKNDAKRLIQAIALKLKDPEMAKKAAQILEEMIGQDKK